MKSKQANEFLAVFINLRSDTPAMIAGGQSTFETLRHQVEAEAIKQLESLPEERVPFESLMEILTTFEKLGRLRVFCGLFHVASINARVPAEPPTSMLQ